MYALYKIKQNKNKLVNILANLFLENPASIQEYVWTSNVIKRF